MTCMGVWERESGSKKSLTSTLHVDKANNWAEPWKEQINIYRPGSVWYLISSLIGGPLGWFGREWPQIAKPNSVQNPQSGFLLPLSLNIHLHFMDFTFKIQSEILYSWMSKNMAMLLNQSSKMGSPLLHEFKRQASFFFKEKIKTARLALTDVTPTELTVR